MIQKKVCMLGAFAVGKTSLVRRFVESIFSEKYQTTVGVKIDKKSLTIGQQSVNLILWDLHGEDDFQKVRLSYLRGSSGYLLVVDGTRQATLDRSFLIQQAADATIGRVPFLVILNKADLMDQWELDREATERLVDRGWTVLRSSAKTGEGVEEAFHTLAARMLEA